MYCAQGLAVKATKGDALLFYSLKPNGDTDPTSMHGSCPTTKVLQPAPATTATDANEVKLQLHLDCWACRGSCAAAVMLLHAEQTLLPG